MYIGTPQIKRQQGMALFVSLVFLLILTILGVSSMQSTILEEKMAGNFNDQNRAFQASESSLRAAESWLQGLTVKPDDSTAPSATQVWKVMNAADDPDGAGVDCAGNNTMWWIQCDGAWWGANAAQPLPVLNLEKVSAEPYYLIEEHDFLKDSLNVGKAKDKQGVTFYRITSRATGGSNLTVAKTQSFYSRRF